MKALKNLQRHLVIISLLPILFLQNIYAAPTQADITPADREIIKRQIVQDYETSRSRLQDEIVQKLVRLDISRSEASIERCVARELPGEAGADSSAELSDKNECIDVVMRYLMERMIQVKYFQSLDRAAHDAFVRVINRTPDIYSKSNCPQIPPLTKEEEKIIPMEHQMTRIELTRLVDIRCALDDKK